MKVLKIRVKSRKTVNTLVSLKSEIGGIFSKSTLFRRAKKREGLGFYSNIWVWDHFDSHTSLQKILQILQVIQSSGKFFPIGRKKEIRYITDFKSKYNFVCSISLPLQPKDKVISSFSSLILVKDLYNLENFVKEVLHSFSLKAGSGDCRGNFDEMDYKLFSSVFAIDTIINFFTGIFVHKNCSFRKKKTFKRPFKGIKIDPK